jgi:hypothetical protein
MTLYLNIFFALLFVAFTIYYTRNSITLTFLYGLLFYQAISVIPSLVYIEEGIYINEQGRFTFFTGATILAVCYYIFTFIVIAMAFKSFNKRRLPVIGFSLYGKNIEIKLLFAMVIIAQGLLLVNAALSPLPFLDSSVTRFTYWGSSRLPFLNSIFGNTAIFIPFALGVLFSRYKKFSVLMLFVFYGYNFMIGQKFSPIISGTFSFLLPIVFDKRKNIKNLLKKAIAPVIIIGTIMIGIMYQITYHKYETTPPFSNIKIYDPNEAMLYRIFGLQGHLMWGATEQYVADNEAPKSFNPTDLLYGMPVMMDEFAKDKKLVLLANSMGGYNFTNAYPGILFKIFPLSLSIVFHTFLTIAFLALMGWILKEFMVQGALFLSVIAYQLFNWTMYAFTMGYFYKVYFALSFMIVYGVFIHLRKKRQV